MARSFQRHPAQMLTTAQRYTHRKCCVLSMLSRVWPHRSVSKGPSPPLPRTPVLTLSRLACARRGRYGRGERVTPTGMEVYTCDSKGKSP